MTKNKQDKQSKQTKEKQVDTDKPKQKEKQNKSSSKHVPNHPALKGFRAMSVYGEAGDGDGGGGGASQRTVRYLYYKQHSHKGGDGDDAPSHPTLFVVNIPFYYTTEHLEQLFSSFGELHGINFLQYPLLNDRFDAFPLPSNGYYRSAYVQFAEEDAVKLANNSEMSETPQPCPTTQDEANQIGLKKWLQSYHAVHPAVSSLQSQVDLFMSAFDSRVAAERASARTAPTVDDEGFTLVRARGDKRRGERLREEETERAKERAKKKEKKLTVVHFYKHQEREQKKERLEQLRARFEADKLKIAKMKQDRKFKPY